MAMSALIKSLEDIMRKDAGLNGDAQYIEQITWLLFLKAFDAKEMEWEFYDENYKSLIPNILKWHKLAGAFRDIIENSMTNGFLQIIR